MQPRIIPNHVAADVALFDMEGIRRLRRMLKDNGFPIAAVALQGKDVKNPRRAVANWKQFRETGKCPEIKLP